MLTDLRAQSDPSARTLPIRATVYFAIALFWASLSFAAADENPFGLPIAHDPARPGCVMLHGGGRGLQDEVRREFVRLAGGRAARIVLVPSEMCQLGKDEDGAPLAGGESIADYERRLATPREYGRWVALRESGQVADFQFLYRDRERDPDEVRFYALLAAATGVWLPAVDQASLPSEFAADYPERTSHFQLALRSIVARGGVVGGLGGGMSSLPETIIAGGESDDGGWVRAQLAFGLALFDGAVVDQNFNIHAGRLERLTDLLRSGPPRDRRAGKPGVERRTIGIGVERQTVAILQGDTVRTLGDGRTHLFLKSNGDRTITWRTLAAGDDPITIRARRRFSSERDAPSAPRVLTGPANPFGLPEPIDPRRLGRVVLHGGGSTREITQLLPQLAGHAAPRLVHCPASRESCRPSATQSAAELAAWLEAEFNVWRDLERSGRFADLAFITTNQPADANRRDFVAPLDSAQALWFCGGDQRPLAELFVDPFAPTLFQQSAAEIVRRGGVVGGSSAGLAIMADVMIEGGEPENGRPADARLSRGLGLLRHVLAEQHFDARGGRIERLTGLLRDHKRLANFAPTCRPRQMIGLAVEEDTALIVQGPQLVVSGQKLAHVFLQSRDPHTIAWHALQPGDAAIVHDTDGGHVLELLDWELAE